MLRTLILLPTVAFVGYLFFSWYLPFRKNLEAAKRSGITYKIVPVLWVNRFWLSTFKLWVKLLAYLPEQYVQWVDFVNADVIYEHRYSIFEQVGHDTFMTVSPGGNCLITCEPAVISQITTRRNDFPKPTFLYRALAVYGENVVSSEGQAWRHHRKATSPPFTEKNNHLVWSETISQAESMLSSWLGADGKGDKSVDRIADDTMRLSLHVISGAGFGRSLRWPQAERDAEAHHGSKITNDDEAPDPGHKMTYVYALHSLLDTILYQFIVPRWMLKNLPILKFKEANAAYAEWKGYMQEAVEKKKKGLKSAKAEEERMDILGQLVKSQLDLKTAVPLTQSEILGNMFVMILAGHETAANSIHFAILYLAMYPDSQRRLQDDLEQIFHGKPPAGWDYDRDLPALFGGMAGAVLAEELRLLPPVVNIPKSTIGAGEQKLTVEGKECIVPGETFISLATIAAQRNPKYWPLRAPTYPGGHPVHPTSNLTNDLEEFHPERWLMQDKPLRNNNGGMGTTEKQVMPNEVLGGGDLSINESADTSERLFKPPKGAYIPFSEGYRSCLGRRFAQVEVLALLAVLYQNHSIELAVDKYATDEELAHMDVNQKAEVWQRAAEDARTLLLTGMGVIISLQIHGGTVPFRVVPKGQEKFPKDIDEIWKRNNPDKCKVKGNSNWKSWRGDTAFPV